MVIVCSLRLGAYKKHATPKKLKLVTFGEQNWGIEEDRPGQVTFIINIILFFKEILYRQLCLFSVLI